MCADWSRYVRGLNAHLAAALMAVWSLLVGAATPAQAAWPERPVTIVVPYPPGGNTDVMARLAATELQKRFGQPFIVDNRPGAGGGIATQFAARAAPDGYTLLWGTSAQLSILPFVQKVSFDPLKDFAPIAVFGSSYSVLGISAALPAPNLQTFIDYVRAKPGALNYGSPGTGTYGHLVSASFTSHLKLDMQHVPYKGGAQALTDLIGGQIQMYFGNASELLPHRTTKEIRLLAVSTPKRAAQVPDLPAIAEIVPGFSMAAWNGLLAPAGTPDSILAPLADATLSAASKTAKQLAELGIEPGSAQRDELRRIIIEEQAAFEPPVRSAGLARQ